MKKTLSVLALLLSVLTVLSFGAVSVYAETESAESNELSEVSAASEASAATEASEVSAASSGEASALEASDVSGEESGVVSDDGSSEESSGESSEESQDGAAAATTGKGGGFPWGLVTFLGAVVIFAVICFICIKAKNRFGRWLRKFFRDYKSELNKVTWPSREVTLKSTAVVLVCLVVSGAVVGLLDFGLAKLVELLTNLVK